MKDKEKNDIDFLWLILIKCILFHGCPEEFNHCQAQTKIVKQSLSLFSWIVINNLSCQFGIAREYFYFYYLEGRHFSFNLVIFFNYSWH